IENKGSVSAPGVLAAKDDDSSTTKSGISGGAVVITDEKKQQELTGKDADTTVAELNRDVNSSTDSNGLDKIFDEEEIKNGFEITQAFVQEANTFVQQQAAQLEQDKEALDAELKKPLDQQNPERIQALTDSIEQGSTWEMGGTGRTVLTALTTAASGNVTGSASQMIESVAVNYLQSLGAQKVKAIADELDSEEARAALHAVVGCVGASAQGNSCSSGAAGASAAVVVNNLLDSINDVDGSKLDASEQENRKNLVTSIIAGVTDAAGGEATVAAAASQIETESNSLAKIAIAGVKLSTKAYKKLKKQGKISGKDLKEWIKEEGLDIAESAQELLDGDFTIDDIDAALNLVLGFNGKDIEKLAAGLKGSNAKRSGSNPTAEKKQPVIEGETDTYGSAAPRSEKDGLTPDHIPSFAAIKQAVKNAGIKLSDTQLKALRKTTNCVVVKTCEHQSFSRTFGGRNSDHKITHDARDLYKAAQADLNAWEKVWRQNGWSDDKIRTIKREVHDLNSKLFAGMGIKYGP
ncbi:hypothetical protein, partial [Endozoicomonas sp. ALB115]|uniref:hypothetical protein n=2 Tax=unclassified Endozoicomonas TaxID=2644528 RepID=UPI003BB644E7